jgi:hypothetical protein
MTELAIIIPTVDRPHLLAGLLASIQASTTVEHTILFVAEETDALTIMALGELDGEFGVLLGDYGGYTAAANAGVRATREPYFVVANDDVTFHPRWDMIAFEVMTGPVRVVGIDQGNGRTDCFFLVDRSYLDGGDLYHPEYVSQYCDTEFAQTARARGVWADASGDLIEHRHWTLGKAQMDDNYRRAVAASDRDSRIYESRRHLWQA